MDSTNCSERFDVAWFLFTKLQQFKYPASLRILTEATACTYWLPNQQESHFEILILSRTFFLACLPAEENVSNWKFPGNSLCPFLSNSSTTVSGRTPTILSLFHFRSDYRDSLFIFAFPLPRKRKKKEEEEIVRASY